MAQGTPNITSAPARRNLGRRLLLKAAVIAITGVVALLFLRRNLPDSTQLPPVASPASPEEAAQEGTFEYTVFAFNTLCRFYFSGQNQHCNAAAREAIQLCNDLSRALNPYDPASELSRFNAAPANQPFVCSPLLWAAFTAGEKAHRQSDGVFDITILPLKDLWWQCAKEERTPTPEELSAVQALVGMDKLQLDAAQRSVTKRVAGIRVDFGGLAKGLALDLLQPILNRPELQEVLADLGGNLYLRHKPGLPHSGRAVIANPNPAKGIMATLVGCDRHFIATSSNAHRPLGKQGKRTIGHILNPTSGDTAQSLYSATAITTCGVDSDVFSTAVFIGGEKLAQKLSAEYPQVGFVLKMPPPDSRTLSVGKNFLQNSPATTAPSTPNL